MAMIPEFQQTIGHGAKLGHEKEVAVAALLAALIPKKQFVPLADKTGAI